MYDSRPPIDEIVWIQTVRWTWSHPLEAILEFGGWTVEEALADAAVARRFGCLWDLFTESRRLSEEALRAEEVATLFWQRHLGCPVPCPLCDSVDSCACRPPGVRNGPTRRAG